MPNIRVFAKAELTEVIEHFYFYQHLCKIRADGILMLCLRKYSNVVRNFERHQHSNLNMDISTRKIFSLLFALGLCLNAYSQRQDLIGLNINGEIYSSEFRPSIGLTFEKQFSRHNGFETGLFYRTSKLSGIITYINASNFYSYSYSVSERYLIVPLLYKYYSSILNFSVGPTANFYLGWKQKDDGSSVRIEAYDVNPKLKIGFLTKLSKVIPLNKQLVLEPELRFGSVQTLDDVNLGIGITGKYRF